jgi:hypothetical protein
MTFTWWPLAIGLGLATLMVIAILCGSRRVRARGHCPVTGVVVDVEVQESIWDGRPVDVHACSRFVPPAAVTCERACLRDGLD